MRVAVVHGFYRSDVPSGENVAVTAQVAALREAGHDVTVVGQHSDDRMARRTWPLEAAATTVTGLGPDPSGELEALAPDVVHVHNLFPHFGTRWLGSYPRPLVATLHNFRPMCAVGTLVREGRRCTECVDTSPMAGVWHGCYRDSRVATVPMAWAQRGGAPGHPVIRRADRLIAISPRAVEEYVRAGVGPERMDVVPNFVAPSGSAVAPVVPWSGPPPQRWLFAGRLSREKGLHELLAAWPAGRALDVVGDGDRAAEVHVLAGPDVSFLGQRDNAEVRAMLLSYTGLLVPSQWPEAGPPLTYLEALSSGLPVVAFAGNGAADDVAAHGTGVVVPQVPRRYELVDALDAVAARYRSLSAHCRRVAEERFAAPAWVSATTAVYAAAIAARSGRTAPVVGP